MGTAFGIIKFSLLLRIIIMVVVGGESTRGSLICGRLVLIKPLLFMLLFVPIIDPPPYSEVGGTAV